jgi:hemerythrin-like domain-containing protein
MAGSSKSKRRVKEPRQRRGNGLSVDPVALLKREHEMISEQLSMIETTLGSHDMAARGARKGRVRPELDRDTLRDLLQFFTGRIGVHFKREAVLLNALRRLPGHREEENSWFDTVLIEHGAMLADASAIAKQLNGRTVRSERPEETDPFGMRAFIRQYRNHLSHEERVLFVLADMRMTEEQKQRVSRRMLQV